MTKGLISALFAFLTVSLLIIFKKNGFDGFFLKNHLTKQKKSAIMDRSTENVGFAGMAQLVEHVIGNDEVISSTLIASSRIRISIAVRILFFVLTTKEQQPAPR